MPNMPLDILVEIFSFLHPRDLLNLARTSPAFRPFLISRSSSRFWTCARQTVEGLPDCPPYLSEPAYANLTFFPYCHVSDAFQSAWAELADFEGARRLVEEKAAAVSLVQQACIPLYDWKDLQVQNRANELHGVRTERYNTLLHLLRQEGWGEELDMMHEDDYEALSQTPFARKAQKLTPRSWPNIRDDAHAFMDDVQSVRLQIERQGVLRDRFAVLNHMINCFYGPLEVLRRAEWDMDPTLIDLALTPGFRALWDAPGNGPVVLNATDPANISATIEFAMKDWKDALETELEENVRTAIPELAEAEDPLSLAIAGFSCASCGTLGNGQKRVPPLRFSEILAHACFRSSFYPMYSDLYTATASELCDGGPLSLERATIDRTVVQKLRAIVEALGLDPLRATLEDLNNCEVRLWCTQCQHTPLEGGQVLVKVEAFDWMRALEHHNHNRHTPASGRSCRWRALGDSEARSVRRQETRIRGSPPASDSPYSAFTRRLGCHFCPYNCVGSSSMVLHLQEHDKVVDNAGVSQYSYEHLDNKPPMLPIWVHYLNAGGYVAVVSGVS